MKFWSVFLLMGLPALLHAQSVEHWWLPQRHSYYEASDLTLDETAEGMLCTLTDDSTNYVYPGLAEKWRDLCVHMITFGGELYGMVAQSLGPFVERSNDRFAGEFEFSNCRSWDGLPLFATTAFRWVEFSTGSRYGGVTAVRLHSFESGAFRSVAELPEGRKPAVIRLASGALWVAWESIISRDPLTEFRDRHYRAEIRVARLSPDYRVEISYAIGPGYSPQLVERADGTVFVLYRTADHSEAREHFGLRLTSLSGPGGGDAVIDDGLSIPYWWYPELQVLPTPGNTLTVVMDRVDSVVVYHCSAAANITRSAVRTAGNDKPKVLLTDQAGRTILLWRMVAGEEIVWSSMENGLIFNRINAITGTAAIDQWKAFKARDGFVKIIAYASGSGELTVIPNATSDAPVSRTLIVPQTSWGKVLDWRLDRFDDLWLTYRQEMGSSAFRCGIYRVRDVSLHAPALPAAAEAFQLFPNYPNPFNPTTSLSFTLANPQRVSLVVTSLLGSEIRRLVEDEELQAGKHHIQFDASGLPSGVYLYRLIMAGVAITRSMLLQR